MTSVDALIATALATSDPLSDDDTPKTVGGWDSIAHLVMLTSIEDALGLRFTDDEITSIQSIGDVRRLVASKTAAKAE